MKIKNKLLILIMIIAIASTFTVPAFAVSKDKKEVEVETARPQVSIVAEAAIVMDAETGAILYEKDAYSKREPASVTKIVTCLVALDHLKMDQKITVTADGNPTGNVINVKAGEVFTAEQLIYALMLPSANDAAVALAVEIAGSEEEFCKLMNQKASELGAKDSNFMNPNGLNWPGHENHLTTAYDLAVITREALKNDEFRKIVGTLTYEIPATNKSEARTLINTNKFLWDENVISQVEAKMAEQPNPEPLWVPEYYEGVIGVKTGMTSTAGACFVGAVERYGADLITVVLHSEDDGRFADTHKLWEDAIVNHYDTHVMARQGETQKMVRVKRGEIRKVEAVLEEDALYIGPKGEKTKGIKTKIEANELRAPIKKGSVVGTLKVYDGEEVVCERNLVAKTTVNEGGFLSIFGIPDWMAPFVYITLILILLIGVIIGRIMRQDAKKRAERRMRRGRS